MITKKYYKLIRVSYADSEYLRIKNISNETGVFKMVQLTSFVNVGSQVLKYSTDGITWTSYDFSDLNNLPEVQVPAGGNIYFKGNYYGTEYGETLYFNFNKNFNLYGNICSLIDEDPQVFSSLTYLPNGRFAYLFKGNTYLKNIDIIISPTVTSASSFVFYNTFSECTNLETVKLEMPQGLNFIMNNTFAYTFQQCTNLVTADVDLQYVTSAEGNSFGQMYSGCQKIEKVIAPNIDPWVTSYTQWWLNGAGTQAVNTPTLYCPTGVTIPTGDISGIPTGFVRVDY